MDGVVETINMASLCKTLIAEFTDIANQMLKTISDLLPVAMGVAGAILVIGVGYKVFRKFIKINYNMRCIET